MRAASTDMDDRRVVFIVGLGNPGPAYAATRHNIGFMAIDKLVQKYGLVARSSRLNADIAEGQVAGVPVLAVKPMAYMNRSGGPVSDICQSYGTQCEDMVVIHDDIDLAYHRLKIKEKGGDGGHNGLRSLIDALGTDRFIRVRMGVGRPDDDNGVADYVLSDFAEEQRSRLEPFLSQAIAAVEVILCEGAKEAMNRFHRKP